MNIARSLLVDLGKHVAYTTMIRKLPEKDKLDTKKLQNWACYRAHKLNLICEYSNEEQCSFHIFQIYGHYLKQDPYKLQLEFITYIKDNAEELSVRFTPFLQKKSSCYDAWVSVMSLGNTRPDELVIYTLSKMLDLHSVVDYSGGSWSTMRVVDAPTHDHQIFHAKIHLCYFGNNLFGHLVERTEIIPQGRPLTVVLPDALIKAAGHSPEDLKSKETIQIPPIHSIESGQMNDDTHPTTSQGEGL